MDDMKLKLSEAVAARLSAAPASKEKDELIEELSDNLYRRFLEMSGAGVPEEEAFTRSLDDLGDVDELLAYLGVEPQAEPDTAANRPDTRPAVVSPEAGGQTPPQDAPQGGPAGDGGVHYSYGPNAAQSDLDAILANVGEICRVAVDQVKEAAKQAKDAIQRRTTVERGDKRVRVHFNTTPEGFTPPAPPDPPAPPEAKGWEFEAELDSDEGRFFAGAGPKEKKDVVYGFGYDKAKGGFFAQWGEYQGGQAQGPRFNGTDSRMEHNEDDSYSVTALRDLRGIEVFTAAGDVTIHVSEAPDAGVIIDGDVDDLDVTCSADGVLTIREGRTASSSFFSRVGIGSADVELYLPSRHWEMIAVTTSSGDVEFDQDGLDVDHLAITTASGDLSCRLKACRALCFKSTSGDLELEGACGDLTANTMSGDISLRRGQFGTARVKTASGKLELEGTCENLTAETMSGDISLCQGELGTARLKTASGDIELDGAAGSVWCSSVSGDVSVTTSVLPKTMELSSKSGDVEAGIPDAEPFSVRMKTVSGELSSAFQANFVNGVFVYGDGSGPAYSMTSVSGSVALDRR